MNDDYFSIKKSEYFIGVDPSLRGTGIQTIDQTGKIIHEDLVKTVPEWYYCVEQNLTDIHEHFKFIPDTHNLKMVYIEGLAFMSASPTLFERCGLLYMLRCFLFENNIPFEIIPPMTLKKWTTTDGQADKNMMMKVAKCRWGIDFQDDNLCDAYCLSRMALEKNSTK